MPEIQDIIETQEKSAFLLGWQWLIITLLCLLTAWMIIRYLKHKKNTPTKINNLKEALEELQKLSQSETTNTPSNNDLSINLSLITRQYLQSQFKNESIFQTHQEFIIDHQDLDQLPEAARNKLATYLTTLADHKYSPEQNLPSEKNKLIALTESLLRGIDSTIPKNI